MKFQIYLKDPSGFDDGLEDASKESVNVPGLEEDEKEALREIRSAKIQEMMSHWVEYGECVTLEFDTEAKTARVVPVAEANEPRTGKS